MSATILHIWTRRHGCSAPEDFHPSLIFAIFLFFFFKSLCPRLNLKVFDDLLDVDFPELPAFPVVAVEGWEASVPTRGAITRDGW